MKFSDKDLLDLDFFGKSSLIEVKAMLFDLGLSLKSSPQLIIEDYTSANQWLNEEVKKEKNQLELKRAIDDELRKVEQRRAQENNSRKLSLEKFLNSLAPETRKEWSERGHGLTSREQKLQERENKKIRKTILSIVIFVVLFIAAIISVLVRI